jgi:preprotein translocase subunit SecE
MARGSIKRFLGEVRNEAKKVTWPDRQTMTSSTGAVLVILVASVFFLGLLDVLYTNVIGGLLSFLTGGAG